MNFLNKKQYSHPIKINVCALKANDQNMHKMLRHW